MSPLFLLKELMYDFDLKSPKLPEDFFELSKDIYINSPEYIDNRHEFSILFNPINPYFKTSKLAYKVIKGKARIVTFFDPDVKYQGENVAYFGYWETRNDIAVNKLLLRDCEHWAKKQGAKFLIGPINFNTYHQYRLNLTKDDKNKFLNEPHNPDYYPGILKECGFKTLNEYVSYVVTDKKKIQNWYQIYESKKDLLSFEGYRFSFITPELWLEKLEEIHKKSEMIFGENFAYSQIDYLSFRVKYGEFFSKLICPKTSLFVFDSSDQIVGAFINFPNYLDLLNKDIPFSELSLERYLTEIKAPTLLLKTVGMVKEHTKMGFLLIRMALEIIPNSLKYYDNYIMCLMQTDNYPSKIGEEFSDFTKKYALYIKSV